MKKCICLLSLLIGIIDVFADKTLTSAVPFRQQMLVDVTKAVQNYHQMMVRSAREGKNQIKGGFLYTLPAITTLHAVTNDEKYLHWAKADMLWLVRSAVETDGTVKPLLSSFRYLQPFCEAFLYLDQKRQFSTQEIKIIHDQIRASVKTHYSYTDWGGQNRSSVDAAGFYIAAKAIPADNEAGKWTEYGNALMYDSWGSWEIEDASIYTPFWLFYVLTGAETIQRVDELMNFITTKYYFEYYSRLLMPNNMLPDWGDGDWTHMWCWYVADLVRAGSYYKNGGYLYFAQQLYGYYRTHAAQGDTVYNFDRTGLHDDAIYCAATALRWLDSSVPVVGYVMNKSEEIVDDLVTKKIAFRNDQGKASVFALLNYRDLGPYGRYQRDYLNQELAAYEEKPHHGHADENSIIVLMDDETILLADGGYRRSYHDGWRADLYHNRIVAREGWPIEAGIVDYLMNDKTYHEVETEKVHFGVFGVIDYSRTRLIDKSRGYTGDRIVLFVPEKDFFIIVDAIHIDEPGHKLFVNMWHPDQINRQGSLAEEGSHYVVSWPSRIPIRREYWVNEHRKDLLIQFFDNRDKFTEIRQLDRRFNPSQAFYQYVYNYFFKGQRLLFLTVLAPHDAGLFKEEMLNSVKILSDDNRSFRTLALSFDIDHKPVTVGLKLDQTIGLTNLKGRPLFDWQTGSVTYGKLKTDADFAFVYDRGDQLEYGFINGCQSTYDGKVLFDMPVNSHMYQGPVTFRVPDIKDKMPRFHEIIKK